jgi:hypothetical protein
MRYWRIPLILVLSLSVVQGINAANPELIWDTQFDGYIPMMDRGDESATCKISDIALSRDGKTVGYKIFGKNYYVEGCGSGYQIHGERGVPKEIINKDYNYQGISWENDSIIAWVGITNIKSQVFIFSLEGTQIKDFSVETKTPLVELKTSPDGKFIGFVNLNKISIIDNYGNQLFDIDYEGTGDILSISIATTGETAVFVGDEDNKRGFILLYNSEGVQTFKREIEFKTGYIKITPYGKRIVIGVNDYSKRFNGVIMFDNQGTELWRHNVWEFGRTNNNVNDVEVVSGGEQIILNNDSLIEILNGIGEKMGEHRLGRAPSYLAVSEKGEYILASTSTGHLYYLDNSENVKPSIVVLANSIDYKLNSDFVVFLKNKGMSVNHITAAEFEDYKDEKFIVILGGPDAPEGVGDIVKEVLMNNEQNELRNKGNRKMHVKTNVWTTGQRVSVIAGSDRTETQSSASENKAQISVS